MGKKKEPWGGKAIKKKKKQASCSKKQASALTGTGGKGRQARMSKNYKKKTGGKKEHGGDEILMEKNEKRDLKTPQMGKVLKQNRGTKPNAKKNQRKKRETVREKTPASSKKEKGGEPDIRKGESDCPVMHNNGDGGKTQ